MGEIPIIGAEKHTPQIEVENKLETAKAALDMKPILNRIFIYRTKILKVGQIIIPNSTRQMELSEGIVVAAGPTCEIAKVDDYILFGKYAGATVERNGCEFVMLDEVDILAVKDTNTNNTSPEGVTLAEEE